MTTSNTSIPETTQAKSPQGKTAVRTLILGIFSILWCLFPVLGFVGFATGIAALILGSIRLKKEGSSSYTIAGMVMGGVAILLFITASIFYLALALDAANDAANNY